MQSKEVSKAVNKMTAGVYGSPFRPTVVSYGHEIRTLV